MSSALPRPWRARAGAAALAAIAIPIPTPPGGAPQAIVQSFYQSYQNPAPGGAPLWDSQNVDRTFSDRLARSMTAAERGANPSQPAGCAALTPFAGAPGRELAGLRVQIEHLSANPAEATAVASFGSGDGERTVLFDLVDTAAGWRIDDIAMRPGQSWRQQLDQCAAAAAVRGARHPDYRIYVNAHYGYSLSYPPSFAADPAALSPDGSGASFTMADKSAQFTVSAGPVEPDKSLSELFAAALRDTHGNGKVTYARRGRDWFVVSGLVNGRIYYQRTVLSKACATLNTLVVEYPTALRRSLARAVTVMSRSFRPGGPPCQNG